MRTRERITTEQADDYDRITGGSVRAIQTHAFRFDLHDRPGRARISPAELDLLAARAAKKKPLFAN